MSRFDRVCRRSVLTARGQPVDGIYPSSRRSDLPQHFRGTASGSRLPRNRCCVTQRNNVRNTVQHSTTATSNKKIIARRGGEKTLSIDMDITRLLHGDVLSRRVPTKQPTSLLTRRSNSPKHSNTNEIMREAVPSLPMLEQTVACFRRLPMS